MSLCRDKSSIFSPKDDTLEPASHEIHADTELCDCSPVWRRKYLFLSDRNVCWWIFENVVSAVLLATCSHCRDSTKMYFLIVLEESLPLSWQYFHSYSGYENRKASRSGNFIFIYVLVISLCTLSIVVVSIPGHCAET